MNGKFEEKLTQLAFGELSPKEAARVEAQASKDPEALRMLNSYRGMKSGLSDLTEIPEDQFSKDRLRDAILTQGLKPKAVDRSGGWNWLWMPTAACVLAAGLMMFGPFGSRSNEPVVAINDGAVASTLLAQSPLIKSFDFSPKEVKPTPVIKKNPVRVAMNTVSQNDERQQADELIPMGNEDDEPVKKSALQASLPKTTISTPNSVIDDTTEPVLTSPTPPIVLIEENKDEMTGANRATEVGTASNVVIGG